MEPKLMVLKRQLEWVYGDFVAASNRLDPELRTKGGICGNWSPKEVIAHLIGWDGSLTQFIVDIENFDPPYDVDAFNQKSVQLRAELDWETVMANSERTFQELVDALEQVNPEMKNPSPCHCLA